MMRKRILLALVLLATPGAALAAPKTFDELARFIVSILNNATAVLVILGIVVYFFGISMNIMKVNQGGSESRAQLVKLITWGLIVLFVMVSIWGILQLLQNTLFGGNGTQGGGQQFDSGATGNSPSFNSQVIIQ